VTLTGKTGGNSWDTDAIEYVNDMVFVPTPYSQHLIQIDKNKKARDARYNQKRPDRDRGKVPMAEREFVVWDGEGPKDTGYSLLGNSEGDRLQGPNLGTVQSLDFILECGASHPDTIHVSFGFNYDVSNILKDLPWRHLSALRTNARTLWSPPGSSDVYKLEHVSHKWFRVEKDGISVKIYDVYTFFASSLIGALTKWEIGPFAPTELNAVRFPLLVLGMPTAESMDSLSEIETVYLFKNLRSEFLSKDLPQIERYMTLELKYTKILMEHLRETFHQAGYFPRSWHGPAALSRQAIGRHKIYSAMAESPYDVRLAARYAFFGGRFEQFIGGHTNQPVYCADLNSAYPYFCTQLPNLARGNWRRTSHFEPGRFAVYYCRYHSSDPSPFACYPLPFRDDNHNVIFPYRTEGWYWAPEAALCEDDKDGTIVEGWVFDEDDPTDKPFAWVAEYYRRRMVYKNLPTKKQQAPEFTFKLIINAIYGCLAQRTGWDKINNKAPKTHQLEWAGFITSGCRAAVYRIAKECGDSLVSIDTDGITSLKPFTTLQDSKELGGWGLDEYQDGIFWQSGIYALQKRDGSWKAKMRGIERGSDLVETLFKCLRTGEPIKIKKNIFVGYGLALQGLREEINTWKEMDSEYAFGGGGKRQHITPKGRCPKGCDGNIHRFGLWVPHGGPRLDFGSRPHILPWVESSRKAQDTKRMFDDQTGWGIDEWAVISDLVN
jgi:hypothetical protein